MPRPPIDLTRKIKDILQHHGPLPLEAEIPLAHFERSVADVWNMLLYFERMVDELHRQQVTLYPSVLSRHLIRLNSMMLVNLIESFERFLKELAAVCVDQLAEFVLDKRFDEFQVQTLHAHHGAAFDPQTKANELSQQFGFVLQVAGLAGVVAP